MAQERQGRGNFGDFNPEEFRQRMMDRMKEAFEVTNDDEWKVLSAKIEAVQNAQREVPRGGGFGAFGRGGGRGGEGQGRGGGGGGGGRGGFGGAPNPEMEAVQQAIESKASPEEIKAKLAKLREARKAKEAALVKAQAELLKLLTVRQEAVAITMGLVN